MTTTTATMITSAEARAIACYTNDDYMVINREHREGDLSPETLKSTALIKAALDKLPSFEGTVYRGFEQSIKGLYDLSVGKVFCDPAFFSTSEKENVADDFGSKFHFFVIKCKKAGKSIRKYSCHRKEEEVLFPPGTKFLITKVEGNKVWMEEIVDDDAKKPAAASTQAPVVVEKVEVTPQAATQAPVVV